MTAAETPYQRSAPGCEAPTERGRNERSRATGTPQAGGASPRRVLLTRSDEDCAAWAAALERRGIVPVALPCITAEDIDTATLRRDLAAESARADWLVFTSRRGVEAYTRLDGPQPAPVGDAGDAGVRVAVVGPATADAARELLGRVDLIGDDGTAAGLAASLTERLRADAQRRGARSTRVLLVLAENARRTLERGLEGADVDCVRLDVYRTVPAPRHRDRLPLASLGVDAVFLASPSAVTGFVNQVDVDTSARLVAIGPSTADAAKALGLDIAAEAREPSLEGLLEAMP